MVKMMASKSLFGIKLLKRHLHNNSPSCSKRFKMKNTFIKLAPQTRIYGTKISGDLFLQYDFKSKLLCVILPNCENCFNRVLIFSMPMRRDILLWKKAENTKTMRRLLLQLFSLIRCRYSESSVSTSSCSSCLLHRVLSASYLRRCCPFDLSLGPIPPSVGPASSLQRAFPLFISHININVIFSAESLFSARRT